VGRKIEVRLCCNRTSSAPAVLLIFVTVRLFVSGYHNLNLVKPQLISRNHISTTPYLTLRSTTSSYIYLTSPCGIFRNLNLPYAVPFPSAHLPSTCCTKLLEHLSTPRTITIGCLPDCVPLLSPLSRLQSINSIKENRFLEEVRE